MTLDIEIVQRIADMQKRVARLETLEYTGIIGGGGFTLIDEHIVTVADTDTEVVFADIDQGFQHLCFIISARLTRDPPDGSGGTARMEWRFNGDAGENYRYEYRYGRLFRSDMSDNEIAAGSLTRPHTGVAESDLQFNAFVGWINHYHDATKKTPLIWHNGTRTSSVGDPFPLPGEWIDSEGSGVWKNTAAITSVWISSNRRANHHFKIASKFSMYGVGEAN